MAAVHYNGGAALCLFDMLVFQRERDIVMLSARNRYWVFAAAALGIMAAFLFLNIPLLYMHPDEELSYRSTNGDLAYIIDYQQSLQDNQAPLWFVTFGIWRTFVGDAEFTSRVFSILLTMVALSILYRIGASAFTSRKHAGAFAILVLIGNAFFFQYALDIRPYPMTMVAAAISVFTFQRWFQNQRMRSALYFGLSIALILYVHYLLILLVVVEAIYLMIFVRLNRRLVVQGMTAGAIGFVLFLPWFPTFIAQVNGIRAGETISGAARGIAGIGVSTQITSPQTIGELIDLATNGLPLLFAAVILAGMIRLWRERAYWLAFFWAFLTPSLYLLANLAAAVYAPRFVSSSMLGFALVLGASIIAIPIRRRQKQLSPLILLGIIAAQLLTFSSQLPDRIPYRDIFRAISETAQPNDSILLFQAGENDGFVLWQIRHFLDTALQANVTADLEHARQSRRIWYITGALLTDPAQAVFAELEPSHPVQSVIGRCDRAWCYVAQLMEAPPQASPLIFGEQMPFYGIDVDEITREVVRARLWWMISEVPSRDYSIGLHLLDSSGRLVAQHDGAVLHYGVETVQTSQMQPGKIYMDERTLSLPADLPSGMYTLALVVYNPEDGIRLSLPDGSDYLMLETITVP